MSKQILLTRGQVAIVDDEDFDYLNQWKWFAKWDTHTNSFYAVRNDNDSPIRGTIFMHRFLLNTQKGFDCDHKDRDTLNNQKSNLRNCSHSHNVINSGLRKDNTSGYKGVAKTSRGKWCAKLVKNQKIIFQKNFDNPVDAAKAYDAQALLAFGQYAFLNFPINEDTHEK